MGLYSGQIYRLKNIGRRLWRASVAVGIFLGTSFTALGAVRETEGLEGILDFRSLVYIDGVLEFSIFNHERQRSEWLKLNEQRDGYHVKSFDDATNSLVIHYGGRVGIISLAASRIAHYIPPPPPSLPPEDAVHARHGNADAPPVAMADGTDARNVILGVSPNDSGQVAEQYPSLPVDDRLSQLASISPPPAPPAPPLPGDQITGGDGSQPGSDGGIGHGPGDESGSGSQTGGGAESFSWRSLGMPPPDPPIPPPNYSPDV